MIPGAAPQPPVWPTHAQYFAPSTSAQKPAVESEPATLADVDADADADGGKKYVLQVAAFRDVTAAQRGVREIEFAPLRIIATRRNAQNWYVLILGAYEELVAAREAGAAYLNAYPRGGVWIRTAADLEDARIKP